MNNNYQPEEIRLANEIADQLKVSKSFVKNQLYKAYDFVRQYLSKHGELYFPMLITMIGIIK